MRPSLTSRQRALLDEAIDCEIDRLERCRKLLRLVDASILKAGKDCLGTDSDFVQWLCAPARALAGQISLQALRKESGRWSVVNHLRALEGSVYLRLAR